MSSLKMHGQQVPIEVIDLGETMQPRYWLVAGWRGFHVLRGLFANPAQPLTILAFLRMPAELGEAYLAMVEKNEICVASDTMSARIVIKSVE
ncbi:hypothetical protein [Palleronia sp. LCG004]|uniref:hypothetical protein n=1 Tax=Palleronia sp. LCG004 TaxID=3079304 RepID=UPI002942F47D|nr:hypothetical protein [Palleronia sp. LCG004]WOI58427.1 hypothetical protein RVY76_18250 [Palleronia sp. LCG004]